MEPQEPYSEWPEFPPATWRDTYATLHMWTQIVGKTRLALAPMENHWWQVALYVTSRGLTTSPMPYGNFSFSVEFDFISHQLTVRTSRGAEDSFALSSMAVAEFFARYMRSLRALAIEPTIIPSPVEVEIAIPFMQDHEHAFYDPVAAHRCWQIVAGAERVMKRFRGGFTGKQSPVHFFWGSFDLASTRFSGRRAPVHPGGVPNCPDRVMVEAYSHECSSVGWWPGGGDVPGPAFYSYTAPEPSGFGEQLVRPPGAVYPSKLHEFLLMYDHVRRSTSPRDEILEFAQSTYEAGANLAGWDRASLERRPPG